MKGRQRVGSERQHRFVICLANGYLLLVGLGVFACASCFAPTSFADEVDEATRQAFRSRGNFPWFDPDEDRLQRVDSAVDQEGQSTNRDSDWGSKKSQGSDSSVQSNQSGASFMGAGSGSLLSVLLWGFIGVLLCLGLFVLIWALFRLGGPGTQQPVVQKGVQTRSDSERIESLPFEVKAKGSDFLALAAAARDAGEYDKAIIYLYSHMLLRLDRRQIIRLARGKTNRQYLGEIAAESMLRQLMERTMITFERAFFGQHTIERTELEDCWSQLDQFNQWVETS